MKLVCFDLDGVIFQDINFWMELHKVFGTLDEGKKLTEQYLDADYETLVKKVVVELWKGKNASPYYDLVDSLEYVPGIERIFEYLEDKNVATAIISASSLDCVKRAQKRFGIDHTYANTLHIDNGTVAGTFTATIAAGKQKKAQAVKELQGILGIDQKDVLYIGDSDKDIAAFQAAGTAIAFNPTCETTKQAATHVVHNADELLETLKKYV